MRGPLRLALSIALVASFAATILGQTPRATITAERGPSLRVSGPPSTRVAVGLATSLDPSGRHLAETDLLLLATREQPSLRGMTDAEGEAVFRIPLDPSLTALLPDAVWVQAARLSDGDRVATPLSTPVKVQLRALGRGDVGTDRALSRFLGIAFIIIGASLTLSLLAPPGVKRALLAVIASGALGLTLWFIVVRPPWDDARASQALSVFDTVRSEVGDGLVDAYRDFTRGLPADTEVGIVGTLTDRHQLLFRVLAPRHVVTFTPATPDGASKPSMLWCFIDREPPADWTVVPAPKPLRVARRLP